MSSVLSADVLEKLLEDGGGPRVGGVSDNRVEECVVSLLFFFLRHG